MENAYQFIKFSIVGGVNTAITLLSYWILLYLGVNFIIANIIGYCIGIANSYFWNSRWVFKHDSNSKVIIKFICVNLIVLSLNTLLLYFLVKNIRVNAYISQLFATVAGMIINFILNKVWTFK